MTINSDYSISTLASVPGALASSVYASAAGLDAVYIQKIVASLSPNQRKLGQGLVEQNEAGAAKTGLGQTFSAPVATMKQRTFNPAPGF